jgi:hypothetical protein
MPGSNGESQIPCANLVRYGRAIADPRFIDIHTRRQDFWASCQIERVAACPAAKIEKAVMPNLGYFPQDGFGSYPAREIDKSESLNAKPFQEAP